MDVFNFCWQAFLLEAKFHRISLPSSKLNAESDYSQPIYRLRHLFNRGPFIINLIDACISDSTTYCSTVYETFHELASKSHRQICAFSQGPGLEVVGLFHALSKYEENFQNVSVRLVTKYSEWLHLSETMLYSSAAMPNITNTYPSVFELIPRNAYDFDSEVQNHIQNADLILWMKFCSQVDRFLLLLKKILMLMKEGAILFLLESKNKLKMFRSISDCGEFLYGPARVTVTDVPIDPTVCENVLFAEPRCKGNVQFSLWKKTKPYGEIFSTRSLDSTVDYSNNLHSQLPDRNCNKKTYSNGFQQNLKVCETIASGLTNDPVKSISNPTHEDFILLPGNSFSKLNASEEMPNLGISRSKVMFPDSQKNLKGEKMVSSSVNNENDCDMNVELVSNNSAAKQPCEIAKVSDFKSEKSVEGCVKVTSSIGLVSSDESDKNISLMYESKANSQVDESLNVTAFSNDSSEMIMKYNQEIKKEFEKCISELNRVISKMKTTLQLLP